MTGPHYGDHGSACRCYTVANENLDGPCWLQHEVAKVVSPRV